MRGIVNRQLPLIVAQRDTCGNKIHSSGLGTGNTGL